MIFSNGFEKSKNQFIRLLENNGVDPNTIRSIKTLQVNQFPLDLTKVRKPDNRKCSKSRLLEYLYTKEIIDYYFSKYFPNTKKCEKDIVQYEVLNNLFKANYYKNLDLEAKDKIIRYAYVVKTGIHSFPLDLYLNGNSLDKLYPQVWEEIVYNFQKMANLNIGTNQYTRLIKASQSLVAFEAIDSMIKSPNFDINEYLVKTGYIKNTPHLDDNSVKNRIKDGDIKLLEYNKIHESQGSAILYELRSLIKDINELNNQDSGKYQAYIREYHREVQRFNNLLLKSKTNQK